MSVASRGLPRGRASEQCNKILQLLHQLNDSVGALHALGQLGSAFTHALESRERWAVALQQSHNVEAALETVISCQNDQALARPAVNPRSTAVRPP